MVAVIAIILLFWFLCGAGKIAWYILINLFKYGAILLGIAAICYIATMFRLNPVYIGVFALALFICVKLSKKVERKIDIDRRKKERQ